MSSNKPFGGHDSSRRANSGKKKEKEILDLVVTVSVGISEEERRRGWGCDAMMVTKRCGAMPGGSPGLTREQVSVRCRAERGRGRGGRGTRIIRALGICLTCCLPCSVLPVNGGKKRQREEENVLEEAASVGVTFVVAAIHVRASKVVPLPVVLCSCSFPVPCPEFCRLF